MANPAHAAHYANPVTPGATMAAPMDNRSAAQRDNESKDGPSAGAYKGAERFSRELAFWNPRLTSGDKAIEKDRQPIEARARDLTRNNGYAMGALDVSRDRVVGSRYRLQLMPDYARLGITREAAREWARQIESMFQSYFDDPENLIDASGRRTGVELLRNGMVCDIVSGEQIVTREFRDNDNDAPYRTCFQMVEPERLSTPDNEQSNSRFRMGVEVGRFNRAEKYWFQVGHPADLGDGGFGLRRWQGVPIRNEFGTLNVFHVFESHSPGHQTRGMSRFAPVIQKLKQSDRLEDAELEISIAAAVYGMAIESQFGPQQAMEAIGAGGGQMDYFGALNKYMSEQAKFSEAAPIHFDGVRIPHLFTGEKLNFYKAEHPTSVFAEFQSWMLRHCARAFGMSYEQLSGDYTKVNYSSARASIAEAWNYVQGKRLTAPTKVGLLMLRALADEWVARGMVRLPAGITNYKDARPHLLRGTFIGAGRTIVDDVKNATANKIKLENGETTLAIIGSENGVDWQEILEQRAEELAFERDLAARLGLDRITGGDTMSGAAAAQAVQRAAITETDPDDDDAGDDDDATPGEVTETEPEQ